MTPEVLRYATFADDPRADDSRGGDPGGVVLNAQSLTDAEMVAVAQAIGFSRTAFVVRETPVARATEAAVRFFGPSAEVPVSDHATVAAAVAIAERRGPGEVRFETAGGPVTVSTAVEDGDVVAAVTSPPTTTRPVPESRLADVLAALRWTRDRLDDRYPAHVAAAGGHHLVLGVRSPEALAGPHRDSSSLAELLRREGWCSVQLFRAEDAATFRLRELLPPGGAAGGLTTCAAAAFGGYLRDLGLVPVPSRVVLRQQRDPEPPRRLLVDVAAGTATVRVTARATRLALSPYDDLQPL
jgi:PhzF family phenazine biosynthesis protein